MEKIGKNTDQINRMNAALNDPITGHDHDLEHVISLIELANVALSQYKKTDESNIITVPFSRLLLSYMMGYERDGQSCFYTNPNFLNIVYSEEKLTFGTITSELIEMLDSLSEFTLAPILVVQINGENKLMGDARVDSDVIMNSETITAPYYGWLPLVFECTIANHYKDDYHRDFYDLDIKKIHAAENSVNEEGVFDLIKVLNHLGWFSL